MSIIRDKLKSLAKEESFFLKVVLTIYNHLPFNNSYRLRGVQKEIGCAQIKKCKVVFKGSNNSVTVLGGSRLHHCRIHVYGSNNRIVVDKFVWANGLDIYIEDDGNEVCIGEHSSFEGNVHLACIEGSKITIGQDCMFSADISVRTGDSHSLVDELGNRINPSKDVLIGNHVWVGNRVLITKGVCIPDGSVVGTGSVVTRKFSDVNVVIAGNPATIIKHNVTWIRERISCMKGICNENT